MNRFILATKKALQLHGVNCQYKTITTGSYDPDTGAVVNAENTTNIRAYPKLIKANQYYYPNLIGKEVVMFYIDPTQVSPKNDDIVVWDTKRFHVHEVQPYIAGSEIALYRVVGVR